MLEVQECEPLTAGFVGSGAARHETFTPRYGWLKKGFDHTSMDPGIFARDDAIERLGVGKNMVRSIRFWCLAFRLLRNRSGDRSGKTLEPTRLGRLLLDDEGWDPYLEDPASLWLLHSQLFVPPYQTASWPLTFSLCSSRALIAAQLGAFLQSAIRDYPALSRLSEKSLAKDASCILRMYAPHGRSGRAEIMCPFTELGLLRNSGDGHSHAFNIGRKRSLPPDILLASSLAYAQAAEPGGHALMLDRLTHGFNSPGCVFKLSETDLGRGLEIAADKMTGVFLADSHGARQLHFDDDPGELFWQALKAYYGGKTL